MISRSHSNLFNSRRNRLVLSLSPLFAIVFLSLYLSQPLPLSTSLWLSSPSFYLHRLWGKRTKSQVLENTTRRHARICPTGRLYGIFCRRDLPLGEDRALELDRGRKKSHKNGCLLELRWTPERPIFQQAERGCARTLVRTQSVTYPFIHTPARNADSDTPALTEWRGKIISRRSGLASEPRSLDSTTCKGETALE